MTEGNEIVYRYPVESWSVGPGPGDDGRPLAEDFEVTAVVSTVMSGDVTLRHLADVEIVPPTAGLDDRGAVKLTADQAAELARVIRHAAEVADDARPV